MAVAWIRNLGPADNVSDTRHSSRVFDCMFICCQGGRFDLGVLLSRRLLPFMIGTPQYLL